MVAVACVLAAIAGLMYAVFIMFWGSPLPEGFVLDYGHVFRTYLRVVTQGIPHSFYYWIAGVSLAAMLAASAKKLWELSAGGEVVADLMGAEYVDRARANPAEARLINVVEEMAIASGTSVPPVYVLRAERAVNALAAGYAPNEAVVIVTQGTLVNLTRDELQGVIAHEYSHILNGDMRLNVRLLGLLYGIVFLGETGRTMVRTATAGAINVQREKQTLIIPALVVGLVLAAVGHAGLVAARLIKAAISREREFLADAASVQFTRNPAGIAGALDSTMSLRLGTAVWNPHSESMSHMFFAQAVVEIMGGGFATHPPIDERIRRVHPRFRRDEYRARRKGVNEQREYAVIDGTGSVVKVAQASAAIRVAAAPTREHIDHAARLLAAIPAATRERMKTPAGAAQVLFALALEEDATARLAALQVIAGRRGKDEASAVDHARNELGKLSRAVVLPLVSMAMPVLKSLKQKERDALVQDLYAMIEADKRVTLREMVFATFARQHLREGAGRPVASKFANVSDVALSAHAVLSLVSHASRGDTAAAFAAGKRMLGIELAGPLPISDLSAGRIDQSLDELRLLAPLERPRIVRACLDSAQADGRINIAEAELVRAVAAALDCPLPPMLDALDPASLSS